MGDILLFAFCAAAGLLVVVTLVGIIYQLATNAQPAISRFGLGFLGHQTWAPNFFRFGAGALLFGTAVTSLLALLLAAPLGIAIALYLSMVAPPAVRAVVGPLVEMLAAVPSVIMGLWGVLLLAPYIQKHIEPFLHDLLGFIPVFGAQQTTGLGIFTAAFVLAVMILPIVASLSRDVFLTVPRELTDGAEALGATRWEVIRGVVLPTSVSGVTAAVVLALGRALGEAIAVSLVIGSIVQIPRSWFEPGYSGASIIANTFIGAPNELTTASLYYVALLLLVLGLGTTLLARAVAGRFDVASRLASG